MEPPRKTSEDPVLRRSVGNTLTITKNSAIHNAKGSDSPQMFLFNGIPDETWNEMITSLMMILMTGEKPSWAPANRRPEKSMSQETL